MVPFHTFKSIPIVNITITDDWNLTPFLKLTPIATPDACTFISGNLHPPIVKDCIEKSECYTLICGQNRLKSIRNHFPEQTHISVLVLPEDISDENILLYLINDKNVSGNFSDMEKAFFLHLGCESRSPEEVSKKFLPLLGEKSQTHIANKLLSLTSLEPEIQKSIHSGMVASKLAYELLTLSSSDRITLHELFIQLELGGGKQKRLHSLCKDLALRHNTSIAKLLATDDYQAILNHPEMNVPQKGASLLALLQKELFPESTEAERVFLKRVRRMKLPENCTVEHSPAFEGDEIAVTMQFEDMEQLEKRTSQIKAIFS